MNTVTISKYKPYIIIGILVLLAILALWLRLLPAAGLVTDEGTNLLGNDPWYNLRQVESMVENFPSYLWFDAMTEYPSGNVIHWGPLFIQIIAGLSILLGAATRPEIMYVASWVPPLMGMLVVPVLYLAGERIGDWKCGLFAALFGAVVSGQFFYRSLFGFVDHHIAESLFGLLFCLCYIITLMEIRKNPVHFSDIESVKRPALFALGTGIAYILGLGVMPTMILFAMVVAVYTLFQYLYDFWRQQYDDGLLLVNSIVFLSAVIGIFIIGFNTMILSMNRYSPAQVVAYFVLIIATAALWYLSRALRGKPWYYYPGVLAGAGVMVSVLLYVIAPPFYEMLIGNFFAFFGQSATVMTIQEARPWEAANAWNAFGFGLLLMFGGFAALIWDFIRKGRAEHLFVVVWSAVILLSTIQHVRYEYYIAVNIALLSAYFMYLGLGAAEGRLLQMAGICRDGTTEDTPSPAEKGKKEKRHDAKKEPKTAGRDVSSSVVLIPLAIGVLFSLLFISSSVATDLEIGNGMAYGGMQQDWYSSLEWFGDNSPDPGVDYYAIYDEETFTYPPESYGVMSWWDYGHYITFVSKRIPNANPFQHGVSGPNGAAAFFLQDNEAGADTILDNVGTKYIITDIEMDTGKFWAMATWYDADVGGAPYMTAYNDQSGNQGYVYTDDYFRTMVSRLHNFDGSMAVPDKDYLVTNNGKIYSYLVLSPVKPVEALQHYRLVHESDTNVFRNTATGDLKYVKIFEYVPGAVIKGDGIIEIPLKTNTGRTFTYRQESRNGLFVVPYPTDGSVPGITTLGPYTITGTGQTFTVTESDIQSGKQL
ncbi:oligosaccharyl transferase, archaeosortase A system-associated [Methanogenium sp. S4BF]|uniref:oligosaccharyl transferase, archaeosortase A system-associated n=1 Tax=Methanogenium sp. S4BF TaxID=1789226 RepID=UPI002417674C|nr:oligosaccharyl transferase, archaeosortase A system-associated [Methanogenium sp. S4BF]WFN34367.1 oligosaccharyl transferase, archaeosortase A system-associated [Methanogenium sp. S4BF]